MTDGYPAGATFDLDSTVDQLWTVAKRVALDLIQTMHTNLELQSILTNQTVQNGCADAYLKDVTYTFDMQAKDSNAKLPADSVQKAQWNVH